MRMTKNTILFVGEKREDNRGIFSILEKDYQVQEAENEGKALSIFANLEQMICAVILDWGHNEKGGLEFLASLKKDVRFKWIPIIVLADGTDSEAEGKALLAGAYDYIRRPVEKDVVGLRVKKAVRCSQLFEYQKYVYLTEFDELTGIYNKSKFFEMTHQMLEKSKEQFVFVHFDIDRFQLMKSYFGEEEGNSLLRYIAENIAATAKVFSEYTYGRMESDVFCMCIPYEKDKLLNVLKICRKLLVEYNPDFNIVPKMGLYLIEDPTLSVEQMYDRAALAAKKCKKSYVNYYVFYDETMGESLQREQQIINDMNNAFENEQFVVYYQPKYDIKTNTICGSEALVRWIHPQKGMVSPGDFIPIFEKNGFITKLDYFVWEEVCKKISSWLQEGKIVYPVSVNVSRVNLYNPKLIDMITELTNKYNIPANLLQLELTESAYTDNPFMMSSVMSELQKRGFIILMDDFGSGYSSLSVLKDIVVDIIKIDMRFFSRTKIDGRGENIIASVVRMAKWLHIPVIAEGVETRQQVEFLRGIGCEYVQGFYFAKPMPENQYEELINGNDMIVKDDKSKENQMDVDFLWSTSPQMEMLFNSASQSAVICELEGNNLTLLRVNKSCYEMIGYDDKIFEINNAYKYINKTHLGMVIKTFQQVAEQKVTGRCEFIYEIQDGSKIWVDMKVRYLNQVGNKSILLLTLVDITQQKMFEMELQKYRTALFEDENVVKSMLIVDDIESNRAILKEIFKDSFHILEADNGQMAKELLEQNPKCADIILLDLIMPVMDGRTFLSYKSENRDISSIPVVIITSDDDPDVQRNVIAIGANDYIIKPFIPEIVALRVKNVLKSSKNTNLVKEYKNDEK